MAGLFDFLSPESRQGNRQWLDDQNAAIAEALRYYLGPTGIPERLGLLAESTPTAGLERAGAESSRMFEPGLSGAQRVEAFGNMLSETAGAGAGLLGMPAAGRMADDLVEAAAPVVRQFGGNEFGGVPVPGSVRTQKVGNTTVQFSIADDGTAEIYSVRTPKDKRGGGSARSAMETILPQLRDEGATSVKLVSSPLDAKTSPARLKGFYESLGFRGTGETANIAGDSIMRMDLPQRTDAAAQQGSEIINLLRSGRAGEVTEQMLDMGDPVLNARLSEYLYSNYDLPMDTASRMGRAEGMGFVPALHGTGDQITAVDPSFFGSGQDLLGSGFYTTTAPARAERYVPREKSPGIEVSKNYAEGGNILPLSVREPMPFDLKEPLGKTADDIANYYANDPFFSIEKTSSGVTYVKDFDGNSVMLDPAQPKHWALQNLRKAFGPSEASNALSDLGFSGVSGPELGGNVVRASYAPSDVRSRFARFDPRLSHLRNLNAAITAGVPLGLLAMQPGQEPQ